MNGKALQGKVAIVTGAGSAKGMGLAITKAFAGAGARVAMLDVDRQALEASAAEVREIGGPDSALPIVCDVSEPEDTEMAVAKTIAESALVKAAIYGGDPNWGRFVSAAGYSGVDFAEKDLSCSMGPFELYRAGVPQKFDAKTASAYLKDNRDVNLKLTFTLGSGSCRFYTSDLTPEYVRLNADYTT